MTTLWNGESIRRSTTTANNALEPPGGATGLLVSCWLFIWGAPPAARFRR